MRLPEYLSVRRAYNVVRQETDARCRITFDELAILSHLLRCDEATTISAVADYQGVSRSNMTHRVSGLEDLGLIERLPGTHDRRNVLCQVTEAGRREAFSLAGRIRAAIRPGMPLSRTSADRILAYADAMGSLFCSGEGLVLLALYSRDFAPTRISDLVADTGMLQPTTSMAVAKLCQRELAVREFPETEALPSSRQGKVVVTEAGKRRACELAEFVEDMTVPRAPRRTS